MTCVTSECVRKHSTAIKNTGRYRQGKIEMQTATTQNCLQARALAVPDHIVVATDLTDDDYLMPHAAAQARACGARVTLVHAVLPSDLAPVGSGATPYSNDAKVDRDARLMLGCVAREMEALGISCDFVSQRGIAADVIQEAIRETGATRLIMGTHGRRGLARIALGSVASGLLSNVDIPVFVAGLRPDAAKEHLIPQRILHPVSLRGNCRESIRFAIDLAQAYGAELTLLHVLDPDAQGEMNPGRAFTGTTQALAALIQDAVHPVPIVHVRVASGEPIEEILHFASATNADWLVLGVDGTRPFWSFRDSTAYKVLAAATCPIITLRHNNNSHKWEPFPAF